MGIGARIRSALGAVARAAVGRHVDAPATRDTGRPDATLLRLYAAVQARHSSARSFVLVLHVDEDEPQVFEARELAVDELEVALDRVRHEARTRGLTCSALVATRTFEVDGAQPSERVEVVVTRSDDGACRETFVLHLDPDDGGFGHMTQGELTPEGVFDPCGFPVPLPLGVLGQHDTPTVDEAPRGAVVDFAAWRARRAAEDTRDG